MRLLAQRIESIIAWIGKAMSWIIAILLLAIVVQVVMRYQFEYTNIALQDSQWYMYAVTLMFGLSYTMTRDGHVRVDFLYQKYSDRTKRIVDLISIVFFTIPLYLFLMWHGWHLTERSFAINEGSPNPGGLPWIWLIKGLIPLGCALLLLESIARLIAILTGKASTSPESEKRPHYDS